MMVREGLADGQVHGIARSYPNAIRPVLQVIPRRNGVSTVAGLYLMLLKNRTLLFADCTVNVEPDAATLAEIAILASEMAHFFGMDPRVAMLSFSNFGNARHALSDKVAQAVKIARGRKLDLFIEGEMHADTAVVEEMLMGMFPFNRLGGSANVLIFPDLNSGNISYKLLERLGGATAIGPLLIGLSKPFNVLPRNTDMENVVNVIAVTVAQAQHLDYTQPLVRSPAHG
jgi:malate dehydrogenase (oxaloacetate-decarboxylating)(NADP+)